MEQQEKTLLSSISIKKIEPNILRYEIPKDLYISLEVITELWNNANLLYADQKRKVLMFLILILFRVKKRQILW